MPNDMSDLAESPSPEQPATPSPRGQTLVEFALVLPMLLVLFLGVADFARVFQAGIVMEASARNGAEAAALERLRADPPPSADPGFVPYYQHLHDVAAQAACAEARDLPNATYVADDPGTPTPDDDVCPSWPAIAVCVHDGQDPLCGNLATGYGGPLPGQCAEITDAWATTMPSDVVSHHVEVRACYRFTTLLNLDMTMPFGWGLSVGDIYLQRTRTFVVDCAPGSIAGC